MSSNLATFTFGDMFAGIGGFHAALGALGGDCLIAAEKDEAAVVTYKRNWGLDPHRDVVELATKHLDAVPKVDVLAGGFPCQPFSKSGRQLGLNEDRGQVFDEMLKIIKARRPALVMLENVRNILGPRQIDGVWRHVLAGLRNAGYVVPDPPLVVSPHRLPPHMGGAPQSRDRVFIMAVRVTGVRRVSVALPNLRDHNWTPDDWSLRDDYLDAAVPWGYQWSKEEGIWLAAWADFLRRTADVKLPGHPLWSDYWTDDSRIDPNAPDWKRSFERQNIDFWKENRGVLRAWQRANPHVVGFPTSRRKFEWQAGDEARDLSKLLIHLRPSGVRVKRLTYAPALVAMTQTPLVGGMGRRMTPRECARLQGFPEWFELDHQSDKASYKQLGNAVNVGVAYTVMRSFVLANAAQLRVSAGGRRVLAAAEKAPADPRAALAAMR